MSYTVGYTSNPGAGGSTSGPASINYSGTPGSSITATVTANAGYSLGSVTASNGTITPAGGSSYTLSGVTANTTVTGNFTANTYTVTFDGQGGSAPSPPSKSVTYNASYGTLATTSRTGYTFDGWYTAPTGGTQVTSGTTVTTASNQTLYAQWTANSYTVTFDEQGGSAPSPPSKSVTYDDTYGTLATTSLTGYTFDGWFTAPTGGAEVMSGTTVATASNHTLYAQWTANNYTVTFDEQGGSAPSPPSKSVTYEDTYGTLATTSLTGYSLDGWFTAPTGGTEVMSGTIVATASNHTLYAHWTANTYTVTFDEQGGSAPSPPTKSVTYDGTYGTLATTSLTGFTFEGWFTAATGGTEVTVGTTVTTAGNHRLYAQWTANTYTVTFDAQGGSTPSPATMVVTYGAAYGTLATTSRTGHVFDGWYTASTGGTPVTDSTLVTEASDHTLYAQWTTNAYTVNYVVDPAAGGSATGPASIAHDGAPGDTITVTVTANAGWSVDSVTASNGTVVLVLGDEYALSGVTDNTTVTASFLEDTVEGEGEGAPDCELAAEANQTADVGDDVCFIVENQCNAVDGDFTWTFTPEGGGASQVIPGESNPDMCLTNVQLEDSGAYVADFENGATKAAATYTVTLSVVAGVPIAGTLGLCGVAGILALGGALTLRRRRR